MATLPAPLPVLRGSLVYLRASERSDVDAFVRWFNDGETLRFVGMHDPLSVALEERWFERMLESQGRDAYHFVICLRSDQRSIGTIGFFDIDPLNGSAEVGITIGDKALWGKGYGTDAMNVLVDFGFGTLRLERIQLRVYDFNTRARRSYEKSGFVLEGTQRHAAFKEGAYHDVQLMSLLREEWAALDRPRSWEQP